MTDNTKLMEKLRTDPALDNTTLGNQAADALEAAKVEIEQLKRARDLAVLRMQESTAYCIELRERLNEYEPGAPMHLNAISKEMTP